MKLQQLRYFSEIVKHQLNISRAANALFTSQSGVSKQVKLLEEELGVILFERNSRKLTNLSSAGKEVFKLAQEVLVSGCGDPGLAVQQGVQLPRVGGGGREDQLRGLMTLPRIIG